MSTLPPDPLAHITVSNDEVTFQTSGIAVKCGHLFFQTQEKEFTGIMIARQVLFQLSREIGINGADTYLETLDDSTRPKNELYVYAAKLASAFGGANMMDIRFQIVLTEIIRNLSVQSAAAQPPTIMEPQLPITDPYLPTFFLSQSLCTKCPHQPGYNSVRRFTVATNVFTIPESLSESIYRIIHFTEAKYTMSIIKFLLIDQ